MTMEANTTATTESAGATDLARADMKFAAAVCERPGGEHLLQCFACGTCTLSCPVAGVTADYSPRRIIRRILLGQKEQVLSDPTIWYCHSCFRCAVHCPQDVHFTTIMKILQAIAVEEGYVTPAFAQAVKGLEQYAEHLRLSMFTELTKTRGHETQPQPEEILSKVTSKE